MKRLEMGRVPGKPPEARQWHCLLSDKAPQSGEVGCPSLANTQGSAPYNLTGALRQGIKAALPNTQKETQQCCQIEDTKKYGPNERTQQNPRKIAKQNGDSQPVRGRVQNTGY